MFNLILHCIYAADQVDIKNPQQSHLPLLQTSILKESEIDEVADFVLGVFAGHEKLVNTQKLKKEEIYNSYRPIFVEAAKQQLSILVRDGESQRLLAATIGVSGDTQIELTSDDPRIQKCLDTTCHILDEVSEAYFQNPPTSLNESIHFFLGAVDQSFANLGLGTLLVYASAKNAVSKGLKYGLSEATSNASARRYDKLGFETFKTLEYKDYTNKDGENPFAALVDERVRFLCGSLQTAIERVESGFVKVPKLMKQ